MQVTALFYAGLRDAFGTGSLDVDAPPGQTAAGLLIQLAPLAGGRLREGTVTRYAVNDSFVEAGRVLCDGDTVLFLPPVSGG